MALGLSPIDELKKKVDLLSSKLDSLSQTGSQELMKRLEDVEDLQLLEKLNSIEMREEIQNIRGEIESLGVTRPADGSQKSDIETRIQDLETRIHEVSVLSSVSKGKESKLDLDALKEEIEESILQSIRSQIKTDENTGEVSVAPVNTKEIENSILRRVEDLLKTSTVSEGQSQGFDIRKLDDIVSQRIDEKIKSLKPGALSGLFSKAPKFDATEIKNSVKQEIETGIKTGMKIELKSELLSDIRTMVNEEVSSKTSDIPTVGVTKGELKTKLSQFKTELVESLNVEKSIDKKLVPVIRSFENLETRLGKTDAQLSTLFSTVPREIKLMKDDLNMRLESHDKSLDQLRRELKEVRLGGIEGYQYLATKEEARRIADDKINVLRNEILANKLAGDDEKYEEALNRVMALDDRFSVLKAEVLPVIERMSELDRLASKLAGIEDSLNGYITEKLSAIDPNLFRTMVTTLEQVRERLEKLEREPNEFVKRSLDSIRLIQDRDRETNEKIAQYVHLETERMSDLNRDIESTVVSKLDEFEKRIPPEDVWIEIESLRSRLAALERTQKEASITFKKKVIAQPAIIE